MASFLPQALLLLAVGGEFGLALVAIAIDATVIDTELGQVLLSAVLLSLVLGPVLIRHNGPLARWLAATCWSCSARLRRWSGRRHSWLESRPCCWRCRVHGHGRLGERRWAGAVLHYRTAGCPGAVGPCHHGRAVPGPVQSPATTRTPVPATAAPNP
jgi:hypothetical protein